MRSCGRFAFAAAGLTAQEASVGFDPAETGELTWDALVVLFCITALLAALFRLFASGGERWRIVFPGRRARLWLPTIMLGVGWLLIAGERAGLSSAASPVTGLVELLTVLFLLINLPPLFAAALLSESLPRPLPVWGPVLGSMVFWVVWYALVSLMQWRAGIRAPVALRLRDDPNERQP